MRVTYKGKTFEFRPCDTESVTQEELQDMAYTDGEIQYDVYGMRVETHLVIHGIGYGWVVD